ncbi:hypothetical protein GCM10020367_20980 [Streptomyces sannanensis]|uniref:Histidine kinase/HSP90-like ATPase domain-containing protein n=1 Tax=Streptomyces sannanensis TaxID=285536 RepID=A0ABP6S922_9ACTN
MKTESTAFPELVAVVEPRERPKMPARSQMSLGLVGELSEVPRVRRELRAILYAWRVPRAIDDAMLVAGELIANAVVHAGGRDIELVASYGGGLLLIEVRDFSEKPPRPVADPGEATGGRGLALVHALTSDWGWTILAGGAKCTWALLAVRGATA